MAVSPTALIVTGLLAGAAASLITATVMLPGGDAEAGATYATAQQVDAVRRALESLTDEQQQIQRRLQTLQLELLTARESGPPEDVTPQPIAASHVEFARLEERVAALDRQLEQGAVGPVMIESVSAALTVIREREEQEREQQRDAAREQRLDERLDELAKQLGLDGYQRSQLEGLVGDMDGKREEILASARAAGDFGSMRDAFTGMRDEFESGLARFLSPSQLASLAELGGTRALLGGGRGGFGGGPPRGGFGGDGAPGDAN